MLKRPREWWGRPTVWGPVFVSTRALAAMATLAVIGMLLVSGGERWLHGTFAPTPPPSLYVNASPATSTIPEPAPLLGTDDVVLSVSQSGSQTFTVTGAGGNGSYVARFAVHAGAVNMTASTRTGRALRVDVSGGGWTGNVCLVSPPYRVTLQRGAPGVVYIVTLTPTDTCGATADG